MKIDEFKGSQEKSIKRTKIAWSDERKRNVSARKKRSWEVKKGKD